MIHRRIWEDIPVDEARVAVTAADWAFRTSLRDCFAREVFTTLTRRTDFSPLAQRSPRPFLLSGMRDAVDRLLGAVARGERVTIHGDYDVDGITSTIILRRAWSCWAPTSITSCPIGCGTATGCSLRASIGCTRRARESSSRSTAGSRAREAAFARASLVSI